MAVIDDDDWSRAGLVAILDSDPRFEVTADLTHDEALGSTEWLDVDVAIVDAADDRREDDQFPGVGVAEMARRCAGRQIVVIVVTGHFWDSAVRLRMREAGADLFYYRPDVQDVERIREIVAHPEREARSVPDPLDAEALFRIGVGTSTKVNAFVSAAQRKGWSARDLSRRGRRSRAFDRERREVAAEARVHAVNTDGRPPDREQDLPGRPQLAKLLYWATRVPNQRSPRSPRS